MTFFCCTKYPLVSSYLPAGTYNLTLAISVRFDPAY
jgi:hypothetical protein